MKQCPCSLFVFSGLLFGGGLLAYEKVGLGGAFLCFLLLTWLRAGVDDERFYRTGDHKLFTLLLLVYYVGLAILVLAFVLLMNYRFDSLPASMEVIVLLLPLVVSAVYCDLKECLGGQG